MTKEEVKTKLQALLATILEEKGMNPDILYTGVPPKNDPDQLSMGNDLRLTTKADFGTLAVRISDAFNIHFPWDEARDASTLGDLVDAVFKEITASVGAVAALAMAMHMGDLRCPNCDHPIGKTSATTTKSGTRKKLKK